MAKKKELKAVTIEEETVKPIETPKVKAQANIKVWTEEELAVLPREEMYAVIADIEAGKATIKPRFINQ